MFPGDDPEEPVTVFRTTDPGVLAVAKSLLDEAGIEFFVVGESAGGLYPGPAGPFPPEIRVTHQNAEAARELLKELA
jgi:Putative prokaryotic signal transducing protein